MALGTNATTLGSMGKEGVLPKTLVTDVFKKVAAESVVMKVAGTTPMPMSGGMTYVRTGDVVAGIVGEGEAKPVVKGGIRTKEFRPVKAAAIMYWSKEARIANPGGYVDAFVDDLTDAVTKAVDMAVIHGKNALNGSTISGVEYLTKSTNKFTLGATDAAKGGIGTDILKGYDAVSEDGYDFDGFIADTRMRTKFIGAVDSQGRPLYTSGIDLSPASMGNLFGLPVAYGKTVGGKVGAVEDTKVRAIGGSFANNLKLGFVETINFKRTDVASIVDGGETIPLWQTNMEAILVEAIFGWVINDVNGFSIYSDGTAAAPATDPATK